MRLHQANNVESISLVIIVCDYFSDDAEVYFNCLFVIIREFRKRPKYIFTCRILILLRVGYRIRQALADVCRCSELCWHSNIQGSFVRGHVISVLLLCNDPSCIMNQTSCESQYQMFTYARWTISAVA